MSVKLSKKITVAIDGPSASGKGTLAQMIANHYQLQYLNTGALYRIMAYNLITKGFAAEEVAHKLTEIMPDFQQLDANDKRLYQEKVGMTASIIAKNSLLRKALYDFQKNFIVEAVKNHNGCVLDGRDTTTVICPEADFKFFVTANVEIRAQRRHAQQSHQSYEEILSLLKQRDFNDFNRQISPLKIADDAEVIDNSALSIEESLKKIINIIESKIKVYG